MWKSFWYLFVIALIAAGAAWLANNPGEFTVVWWGWRIETSFTLIAVLLIGSLALLSWLYRLMLRTIGGPGALLTYHKTRRRTLGQDALRQGLVAVAAGKPSKVRKLAAKANSLLDDPPLTLLLTAQAAQLEGDTKAAVKTYKMMLESPETEFLGLRGLFIESVRSGDRAEALGYAERAFELEPETPWVLNSLFELQSSVGEWAEAAKTLEQSVKSKHIAADVAKRKRAVLYTEQALAAARKGEDVEAENWGAEAASLSPGLVPAAVLSAKKLIREDNLWKAAEVIEKAWTAQPHPDLAAVYGKARKSTIDRGGVVSEAELKREEKAAAKWLKGLADFNKDHIESRLLRAAQDIRLGRIKQARKVLAGLAEGYATVRVCQLMAEVEAADPGDPEETARAAKRWLSKAVSAPRDAHWMCETCGREAPTWRSTCGNCGAFDSLSWKAPADLVAELVLEPVDLDDLGDRDDQEDAPPAEAEVGTNGQARAKEPSLPVVVDVVAEEVKPEKHGNKDTAKPTGPQKAASKKAAEITTKTDQGADETLTPPRPDDPGPDADDPFTDETGETRW